MILSHSFCKTSLSCFFCFKLYAHVLSNVIFPTNFQEGSDLQPEGEGSLFFNNYKTDNSCKLTIYIWGYYLEKI